MSHTSATEMQTVLYEARMLLGRMLDMHLMSVRIGQLEPVADSGVLAEEIYQTRKLLERSDLLCAEIDKRFPIGCDAINCATPDPQEYP